jgi:hypothetical protein
VEPDGSVAPRASRQLNAVWARFAIDLAACLGHLDDGEFLIVEYAPANYFVQFAHQGGFGMRAEAACNAYVDPSALLTTEDYAMMRELGWWPATETAEQEDSDERDEVGSPNFHLQFLAPVNWRAVANLTVLTFRDVYRIGHPARLQYASFSEDGTQVRFPTLRIRRRRAAQD